MIAIDRLHNAIQQKKNPTAVGLDTDFSYLPEEMQKNWTTNADKAKAVLEFNVNLTEKLAPIVPSVKVQVAYYELLGHEGMFAFAETLKYAREKGLITIADVKRNDIGSTAAAYSRAYLPAGAPFESDFITVNGYLGSDGIIPFVEDCKKFNKGLFVLVKTSNPGSGELQNLLLSNNSPLTLRGGTASAVEDTAVFNKMANLVDGWGAELTGECGYSSVGAVVGATHPEEAAIIRKNHPKTFFLIPGYGAQGGGAKDVAPCFDGQGGGGVVNNSRGILTAYKKDIYKGLSYAEAAYEAALAMRQDLMQIM